MFTRDITGQLRRTELHGEGCCLRRALAGVRTAFPQRLCRKGAGTRLATTGKSTGDTFQQCTLDTPVDGVSQGTSSCLSSASRAQGLLAHLRTPQKPVLRAALHLVFGDYWSLLYMASQYAALGQDPLAQSSPTLAARWTVVY